MIYTVFFIIGDKKLKKKVKAENETLAIIKVKEMFKVVKVEENIEDSFFDHLMEALK